LLKAATTPSATDDCCVLTTGFLVAVLGAVPATAGFSVLVGGVALFGVCVVERGRPGVLVEEFVF